MFIRLFGELDVTVDGRRLPPLESTRGRSLLAYLVLHAGVPQSRQRLAFLLWPDSTEGQARTNLRHLLHTLRAAAPEVAAALDVTPQSLCWPGGTGGTDVAAFDAALARAAGAEPAGDEELAALREAVELYGGDLLDGGYDDWLLEAREGYRDRYLWALRRMAGLLARRGAHAEALPLGRDLLRLDPVREDTYRLLMRLHDAAGDRAAAVRTYHECVSTLRRELAVDPSDATRQAYAALMRPGEVPAREAPPAARAALVGREAEWRLLTARWEEAERGGAGVVLVTGEAGIGKTRLVEELAGWCARRDAVVAAGRSYPSEGELGYGVVLSWLRAPAMAGHLARAGQRDRAALGRLLPELGPAEPDAPDPAEQRRRLFEAVARALAAGGRPTLLVADDAQWCDGPSLQVVHYLARLEPRPPLLVVATVRAEDVGRDHPLPALVAGLRALDRLTEVGLERLAPEETAELARRLGAPALDPGAAAALHAETEGNPLFIVETLRSGWDASQLSPRLQSVITARLAQLSEPARRLVGLAATVGREFTAGVLAAASGLDDLALIGALDELWRRGLIREQGADGYDFAHGRIRDVAYEALGPAERRHNHLLIAGALAGDPPARSGDVARHYERAGRAEEAVAWYRRAAVAAQRLYADAEAVRLLERAAGLVPPGRPEEERAVLSALPTPLSVVEGFASPRLAEVQARLLDLAGEAGDEPEPELLRSVVMANLCRREFDGARAVARRLRASAVAAGDDVLLVETDYLLGIGAFWAGDFQAARRQFEAVVAGFDPARRPEHLLRFGHDPQVVCQSRLANTLWFLGRPDDARRVRDAAVAAADQVGHPFSRGVVHIFAALLSVDLGEPETYRRYLSVMRDPGDQQALQVAAEAFLGYADVLDGRHAEGIRRIRSAVATAATDHAPAQQATHLRLLVAAHAAAGDAEGGLGAVQEALVAPGTRIWDAEYHRVRARFLGAERPMERSGNAGSARVPSDGNQTKEDGQ